jgi:lipopolysaccharide transport system ATP-binding protein
MSNILDLKDIHLTFRPPGMGAFLPLRFQKTLSSKEGVKALSGVDLSLKEGGSLGIFGRNGAGKSTLLRVMAGIYSPDKGSVNVAGRVGTILELGAGFHPEMSGKENIHLYGTLLGIDVKRINSLIDEIVDFSELSEHIDREVRTYSSGMRARLAFSVATSLECNLLLIDEVLAVGDYKFKYKCRKRLESLLKTGVSLVLVSHNIFDLLWLCEESIVLDSGKVVDKGFTASVAQKYENASFDVGTQILSWCKSKKHTSDCIDIQSVSISTLANHSLASNELSFDAFDQFEVEITYEIYSDTSFLNIAILLARNGQILFTSFDIDQNPDLLKMRRKGRYRTKLKLPSPLKSGQYNVSVHAGIVGKNVLERLDNALQFNVEDKSFDPRFKSVAAQRLGVIGTSITWITQMLDRP